MCPTMREMYRLTDRCWRSNVLARRGWWFEDQGDCSSHWVECVVDDAIAACQCMRSRRRVPVVDIDRLIVADIGEADVNLENGKWSLSNKVNGQELTIRHGCLLIAPVELDIRLYNNHPCEGVWVNIRTKKWDWPCTDNVLDKIIAGIGWMDVYHWDMEEWTRGMDGVSNVCDVLSSVTNYLTGLIKD